MSEEQLSHRTNNEKLQSDIHRRFSTFSAFATELAVPNALRCSYDDFSSSTCDVNLLRDYI
ncbi:hypothetical protein T4B_10268 [Trichinella pseudospiralis]|uniref:Uncharacterized protein n=1 Tax=Trichinella pseudospiralis TaxID=6337 RepID=A0A0V1EH14_TRIPS|nr:hypothetical protein T4A_11860 [Trichinella pseudospiralis]KRZ27535.1 hypothetical protein T4B_10268 [Trichinella pseudospiralis]